MQFSVIIPALNEERFISGLLEDLAQQHKKNFEVIVIDGKSEDQTKQVAESFIKRLPLRIFTSHIRNVSSQRNQGAAEAKGEYLIFLDADSRISPEFTQKAAEIIHKTNASVLIPPIKNDESVSNRLLLSMSNVMVRTSLFLQRPYSAGGNLIFRKELFLTLKGFDQTLFVMEDHDLVQRAFKTKALTIMPKELPVTFSMRRMEKEGKVLFLSKMVFSTIYQLFNSKVRKPIYSYEMGGHMYKKK